MKSEPTVYGIQSLQRDGQTLWDGVRNYQARNFLKAMAQGDRAFFYHSNSQPPGIAGLMEVVATGLVDPSQFDPTSPYYDPKASPDRPRWHTVSVKFLEAYPRLYSLADLRRDFTEEDLLLLRRGNRLSVMPVEPSVADRLRRQVAELQP